MERQRPSTIYLLHQASQALRSRLEHALRPLGVTGLQYTILGLLDRHEGLSSADLSRRFFVTPQTMNQVVAGLLKRGLLDREASEANRRILKMKLSPEGAALLARCEVIADEIEFDALASVPPADLDQNDDAFLNLPSFLGLLPGAVHLKLLPVVNIRNP